MKPCATFLAFSLALLSSMDAELWSSAAHADDGKVGGGFSVTNGVGHRSNKGTPVGTTTQSTLAPPDDRDSADIPSSNSKQNAYEEAIAAARASSFTRLFAPSQSTIAKVAAYQGARAKALSLPEAGERTLALQQAVARLEAGLGKRFSPSELDRLHAALDTN